MKSRQEVKDVVAWEALDSRGRPTVACMVELVGGVVGQAQVPSGASRGRHEVHELRDGGDRYSGGGVTRAVSNVRGEIASALRGSDPLQVDEMLRGLDGTPQLDRLGGNAVLAVSIASAVAVAALRGVPLYESVSNGARPVLPLPMVNIISGGAHANRVVDVQDFLAVPVGATSFRQAIEWVVQVRAGTAAVLAERGVSAHLVADEGGLAAPRGNNVDALRALVDGIVRSGLEPGRDVGIAIDVAASQFVQADGSYLWAGEGDRLLDASNLITELAGWVDQYPVVSLEDPLGEDDWEGWAEASRRLGGQLVGDDLFVTNPARLRRGISESIANAVLVKPNQAGTLSQAKQVVDTARSAGYATVLSARSGETEESWLADLAVGWETGQIKVGSTMRSERNAKWNRLLQIEATADCAYAGAEALAGRAVPQPLGASDGHVAGGHPHEAGRA